MPVYIYLVWKLNSKFSSFLWRQKWHRSDPEEASCCAWCMVGGSSSSDEAVCIDWITYSDVQEVMEITTGGVFVVF